MFNNTILIREGFVKYATHILKILQSQQNKFSIICLVHIQHSWEMRVIKRKPTRKFSSVKNLPIFTFPIAVVVPGRIVSVPLLVVVGTFFYSAF